MPRIAHFDPALVVDAVACASSLGNDMASVAAAMRCGMSRPAELQGHDVETTEGDIEPVKGHPVADLAAGLDGVQRLSRLLEVVLAAVARQFKAYPGDGAAGDTAPAWLLVAVPEPDRYRAGIDFRTGVPLHQRGEAAAPGDDPVDWPAIVGAALGKVGLVDRFQGVKVIATSVVRWPRLLRLAQDTLVASPDATVVLASIDSFCDSAGLDWLDRTGRLRKADYPVGNTPGEAASAMFLRSADAVSRPGGVVESSLVRIDSIAVERHPVPPSEATSQQGRALAVLLAAHLTGGDGDWWLANLTGEETSAREWATACMEVMATGDSAIDEPPWLSARCIGDIGIAWPGLALGWVAQASARGYAEGQRCGLALLDASTDRSVVSVSIG